MFLVRSDTKIAYFWHYFFCSYIYQYFFIFYSCKLNSGTVNSNIKRYYFSVCDNKVSFTNWKCGTHSYNCLYQHRIFWRCKYEQYFKKAEILDYAYLWVCASRTVRRFRTILFKQFHLEGLVYPVSRFQAMHYMIHDHLHKISYQETAIVDERLDLNLTIMLWTLTSNRCPYC